MAYILENRETGKYLVATKRLKIKFTETDNRNEATSYQTYVDLLCGIQAAHYFAGIDAIGKVWNAPPKQKELQS